MKIESLWLHRCVCVWGGLGQSLPLPRELQGTDQRGREEQACQAPFRPDPLQLRPCLPGTQSTAVVSAVPSATWPKSLASLGHDILAGIPEHLNHSACGGGGEPNSCFKRCLCSDSLFLCTVFNEVKLEVQIS